jgi:hypothetical protein
VDLGAKVLQLSARIVRHILPFKYHRAVVQIGGAHDQSCNRSLAGPGLAGEHKDFSTFQRKADIVNRFDEIVFTLPSLQKLSEAFFYWEIFFEVPRLKQHGQLNQVIALMI